MDLHLLSVKGSLFSKGFANFVSTANYALNYLKKAGVLKLQKIL